MWNVKTFDNLTTHELFQIYKLRVSVFVVEQDCPYQEVDDEDLICLHGMNWVDGQLAAYYRLIPEDDKVHLGRVIVNPDFRKKGLGNQLVEYAIKFSEANYPKNLFMLRPKLIYKIFINLSDFNLSQISI